MLNAIAVVLLAGMMFIPIINFVVGIVSGAALFGVWGAFGGAALAILITTGELVASVVLKPSPVLPVSSRQWFRLRSSI